MLKTLREMITGSINVLVASLASPQNHTHYGIDRAWRATFVALQDLIVLDITWPGRQWQPRACIAWHCVSPFLGVRRVFAAVLGALPVMVMIFV